MLNTPQNQPQLISVHELRMIVGGAQSATTGMFLIDTTNDMTEPGSPPKPK